MTSFENVSLMNGQVHEIDWVFSLITQSAGSVTITTKPRQPSFFLF